MDGFEVENYESLQRRTLKPENRNLENISYINEVKRPSVSLLTKAAIAKHIDPNCETDLDAIRKSEERSRKYNKTFCHINHIFKIHPSDFKEEYLPGQRQRVCIQVLPNS